MREVLPLHSCFLRSIEVQLPTLESNTLRLLFGYLRVSTGYSCIRLLHIDNQIIGYFFAKNKDPVFISDASFRVWVRVTVRVFVVGCPGETVEPDCNKVFFQKMFKKLIIVLVDELLGYQYLP